MKTIFPLFFIFISVLVLFSGCPQNGQDNNTGIDDTNNNQPPTVEELSEECNQICTTLDFEKWFLKQDMNTGVYFCLCNKLECAEDPENPQIQYCQDINQHFNFNT